MKNRHFLILITFMLTMIFTPNTFAQDSPQWHLPDGAKARFGKGEITEIAYSPDGRRLAVASSIGIWLYDAQTGEELDLLRGHTGEVSSVSFSPDGNTLASGGSWGDDTIRLWDAATGRHIRTLTGHTGDVNSVAFSPNGQTLASGGGWGDDTIRLWDAATGRHIRTLTGHTGEVNSVAFSPNGQTLASGGGWGDDTIRLWDAATGRHIRTLTGHTGEVSSVSFSPDGQTLASGSGQEVIAEGDSWDNTIRLWDAATGRHIRTLTGHTNSVSSVSFSPDGQTLASGSWDNTIRLWDAATGRHIRTLTGHTGDVNSVSFSPDGNTLASGSSDGTVLLWEPVSIESAKLAADVNNDGIVNTIDLALVALNFGKTGPTAADVNGDGVVDIDDLIRVAAVLDAERPSGDVGAPSLHATTRELLTVADVELLLSQARHRDVTAPGVRKAILFLEQYLAVLVPKETALLVNYPNPFNPETWIPYQLAESADVTLTIYAVDGQIVRQLALGHQPAGLYESRSRAAYWDGRNSAGEPVASGVYFYTLTAGDFTATRKLLIRK